MWQLGNKIIKIKCYKNYITVLQGLRQCSFSLILDQVRKKKVGNHKYSNKKDQTPLL